MLKTQVSKQIWEFTTGNWWNMRVNDIWGTSSTSSTYMDVAMKIPNYGGPTFRCRDRRALRFIRIHGQLFIFYGAYTITFECAWENSLGSSLGICHKKLALPFVIGSCTKYTVSVLDWITEDNTKFSLSMIFWHSQKDSKDGRLWHM